MIAMNPCNEDSPTLPTIQKVGSGVVIINAGDLDIRGYNEVVRKARISIVACRAAITEYKADVEHIIDSIEEATFAFKEFGAVIHRAYSLYFNRHMWTIKFWPPKQTFRCTARALHNIPITRYFAGAPSFNRGRHFNRRVYWRRK